ncbi:hypothetical protein P7C73_g4510, partial [Tremellales sp. Uapishka_1]
PHHPQSRPATPSSPSYQKETHIGSEAASILAKSAADGVLKDYEEKRDRLAKGIQGAQYLVGDLKNFNGDQWTVRYPSLRPVESVEESQASRPGMSRRTLTFADEPSTPTQVVLSSTPTIRRTLKRSLTLAPEAPSAPIASTASPSSSVVEEPKSQDDFSILRLDLNLGATRHAKTLIHQLEKSSISALIDTRLSAALEHLDLLLNRIHDAHSRVLVTGDLNAGKSTLINALLRRNEVMPTDEQPLTTRFAEVASAKENEGREEIHVLDKGGKYDREDKSTYTVESLDQLERLVADAEADASSPSLRVFLNEADANIANPSILHNGVVDISLIDAPGLNRDSIKTTANFARQEEIDVVVFVVSAANHFTLSAKEFIWQAGHEKAHLFIVVNRYDQIRDKERCKRMVLEQIKQLSPKTYEDAADLVHFVDSAKVAFGLDEDESAEDLDDAFSHLEHSLRSFVLVNRLKSKLGPAQNYVTHLLADVELLASANCLVASKERDSAKLELERVKPVLEKMRKGREGLEEGLVALEESVTAETSSRTKKGMERALERVGRGELAAPAPGLEMPNYPGLLGVWDYAKEVKVALLKSLDFAVTLAENDARKLTTAGVGEIAKLGDAHLPADVERSQRVFNANAMFSRSRPANKRHSISSLGLGLATRSQLSDVNLTDIFDLNHHIFLAKSSLPQSDSPAASSALSIPSEMTLGAASLAFGAFSLGSKNVLSSIISISDLASNQTVQKWALPVLGFFTVGTIGYVIYELPRSIPKNVGRHLQSHLADSDPNHSWVEEQSARVGNETRKVMRLAMWDLKSRFSTAEEARTEIVKMCEKELGKSEKAISWFTEVGEKVEVIREQIGMKF